MKIYKVEYTRLAREDLQQIDEYLSFTESDDVAEHVISKIDEASMSLKHFPERHGHPIELLQRRNKRFREKICGSYRIIYRIDKSSVYIMLVIHSSRNALPVFRERLSNKN